MRVSYTDHFKYKKIFYVPFNEELNGIPLLFTVTNGNISEGVENYRHVLNQNPLDGYFTEKSEAKEYMARINRFKLTAIEMAVLNEMHLTYIHRKSAMDSIKLL